jgi:hypothetical protein
MPGKSKGLANGTANGIANSTANGKSNGIAILYPNASLRKPRQLSPVSNTSDTSHQPTHPKQFAHICSYPLAINCIRFGLQLTLQEGSYNHSFMEEQNVPVTLPGTNAPNCCLTSTSCVTGILPLSYWDKIKFRWILNASLSKPPLSNNCT